VSFEEFFSGAVDDDLIDEVTAFDGVDDVLPFACFSEDGVLSVKVWSWAVSDEKLGAVGVWTSVGHGKDAGLVMTTVSFALALELVAGVSGSGAEWAAALDHEVWDHTVEGKAIVESTRSEMEE